MPEYVAPGVYLQEVDTASKPIPGVSTSTAGLLTARRLVAAMRPIMEQEEPEWSGFNDADPGITLVRILAWASEPLLDRANAGFDQRRRAVRRIVRDIAQAAGVCPKEDEPLKRPRYFAGQLLDDESLQLEQDYHREKFRRHNLNLHGYGIVSGLEVRVEVTADANGDRLVIEPGCAIDYCGEEMVVSACVHLPIAAHGDAAFVSIRHWEHPCARSPAQPDVVDARRIEEACLIAIEAVVPPRALAIARLVRADGRWTVDASFIPPRSGAA